MLLTSGVSGLTSWTVWCICLTANLKTSETILLEMQMIQLSTALKKIFVTIRLFHWLPPVPSKKILNLNLMLPQTVNSLRSGGFPLLPMIIHSRTLTWCSSTSKFPFQREYHLDQQIFCNNLPKLYIFRPYLVPIVVLCLRHVTPSIMPKVHCGHLLVWGDVQWVWHIFYCGGNNAGVSWLITDSILVFTYISYVPHTGTATITTTATQRCAQAGFWSIFSSELGVSTKYKFNVI